jgi:hypothetical protein
MKNTALSFLPPDFPLGQLGQLGQIAESPTNGQSSISYVHIFTGTALGQGGTTRYQNVSGRKKHRARGLPEPPSFGGD